MTGPRYIAKRVGNSYQTVRVDDAEKGACLSCLAGGGGLAALGVWRGGTLGLLLNALGAGLVYRGLTGRNPLAGLWGRHRRLDPNHTPSYPNDHTNSSEQTPTDQIDEASMESFHASDPPTFMPATPAGPT